MYPMMVLETMITKMDLFMTIDKGYIVDMARILGLSLYYVKMLYIGLVLGKKYFILLVQYL